MSRKLTFAMPTLLSWLIASRRSAYAFAPVSSGEVVGLLEHHRVDLVEVDELLDVDRAARLDRHGVEVLVGEHDVAVLLVLVALRRCARSRRLAVLLAHALVPDAPHVLVELVEAQVFSSVAG